MAEHDNPHLLDDDVVYTVASYTRHETDHGATVTEPEIGEAVYGKFKHIPPVFVSRKEADAYAIYKAEKSGTRHVVVGMVLVK